ncbi:hypothetical protein, partial [Aeromonas hydrophila]|uniref:hypothetical protein n=1 Tax=Aeromonas hydrophila TaxID=644 RepID=UPI003F66D9A1
MLERVLAWENLAEVIPMSEPHKDDTMSAIQLIEKGGEDDFLHKPIVPQDPDIATHSGSFVN